MPAPAPEPAQPSASEPGRPGGVEAYWELAEPPFDNSPSPRFFYLSPEHREAMIRLEYAVRQRKGCALLTGDYGCGKTMLVRALLQHLGRERYEIGVLTTPCRGPVEFLREVLYQLGLDTLERSKPRLLHLLNDLLYRTYRAGRDTVIVVDEAQLIEQESIFEELRLLMNIQTDDRFLATVVLVGSPELRARLARLEHVEQRIAIRCHLGPLDLAQTADYIAHRLAVAGLRQPIFTADAVELIFALTGGAPRKINNLCDTALLIGYNRLALEIDRKIVADSSRTPQPGSDAAPWEAPPPGERPPAPGTPAGDAWLDEDRGPRAPWPRRYL